MKTAKKLLALVMILAFALTLAVPALAAGENHTLTIKKDIEGHTYGAYQIFKGTIETYEEDRVLTDVQWGDSIDGAAFLAALKTAFPGIYGTLTTAAEVAEALGLNNSVAHAETFADLAGQYLTTAVKTTNELVDVDGVQCYQITGLDSGYYLVRDEADVEGYTKTDYLLKLVENTDITPKDGKVTVEKWILDGESMEVVSDVSIGETITFELHGTLPEFYDRYVDFYYEFHDTMSKGLTYTGNVVVEFINGTTIQVVDPSHYTVESNKDESTGKTTLEVIFTDLKTLGSMTNADGSSVYTIRSTTKIFVSYTAVLNDDAIVGSTGNPNEVYIEYDNDPNSGGDGHDTTIKDEVHVFTFALDLTKIDGSITAEEMAAGKKNTLEGVEFKLYQDVNNVVEYAIVDQDPENEIKDNTLTGWTTDIDQATPLVTDENGTFTVYGLDEGIYFLKETKPLPGYNSIPDLKFTITAEYDEDKQSLISLKVTYDSVVGQNGNLEDGSVDVTIENNPGSELPSTGGVGTTAFYVFGTILVAAALVLLITKKRMGADA